MRRRRMRSPFNLTANQPLGRYRDVEGAPSSESGVSLHGGSTGVVVVDVDKGVSDGISLITGKSLPRCLSLPLPAAVADAVPANALCNDSSKALSSIRVPL